MYRSTIIYSLEHGMMLPRLSPDVIRYFLIGQMIITRPWGRSDWLSLKG
jgi:hypothetical protein